jgi:phosphopantothenoylcysteine synthetase/decarboxylase
MSALRHTRRRRLRLHRLPKIVDEVKTLDPRVLLVKFKLEVDTAPGELERIAQASRIHSGAELIVANDRSAISESAHPALILGAEGRLAEVGTRGELARVLLDLVAQRLRGRGMSNDQLAVGS